jgi:hypothetical protein
VSGPCVWAAVKELLAAKKDAKELDDKAVRAEGKARRAARKLAEAQTAVVDPEK